MLRVVRASSETLVALTVLLCTLAAVHVLRSRLRAEVDELQVQHAVLDGNREAPRRERWRQGHAEWRSKRRAMKAAAVTR